jgi:uncharacterized protein YbjQ (UPF0145 family)
MCSSRAVRFITSLFKPLKIEVLMEKSMTTTTFDIDGFQVARHLGVVRGIVVRSRSVFGTIGGMLHTIVGGNITLFTELCEKTREEAFDMMVSHAEEMGANAVIGVRYDATELMGGVTEVLCYGTAVILSPKK